MSDRTSVFAHPCERASVAIMPAPDTCDLLCLDLPKAEAARQALPAAADIDTLAAGAKALGDPTRLAIALALFTCARACVCDLGWIVGRDEKLVSHHVRLLKAAGLARSERDGRMVMYELTKRGRLLLGAVAAQEAAV
jgi:ArsR family transcriptional regulator, lead/cadmium/zinc/bismuth-responsive transcriptional repressor